MNADITGKSELLQEKKSTCFSFYTPLTVCIHFMCFKIYNGELF